MLFFLVLASGALAQGGFTDMNSNGESDASDIIASIGYLQSVGVKFDDQDAQGYVPVQRKDGMFHMACVDLLLVAYRAAGYDLASLMGAQELMRGNPKAGRIKPRYAIGRARSVASMIEFLRASRDFHYYDAKGVRPIDGTWIPSIPFQVGDMVFLHYSDEPDRHSGIVTSVDPSTGLPRTIAQVSPYNDNEGLVHSSLPDLFRLQCRQLTGWARPAAWDRSVSTSAPALQ